jgi:Family of unknown function (DUF6165)
MRVFIPVSAGELIDRITILTIKKARIPDTRKLANVVNELDSLVAIRNCFPKLGGRAVKTKATALKKANETLWEIEDRLRALESAGDFGKSFVAQARAVYRTNDRRARLKREIDSLVGSVLREEKWFSKG